MHAGVTGIIVAPITLVDVRVGHTHTGRVLDRGNGLRQCVAVVRIPRTQFDADDPVASVGCRDGYLLAEFVTLVSLAFADAHHLGLVKAVELSAVGLFLSVQAFAEPQQFLQGTRPVRAPGGARHE